MSYTNEAKSIFIKGIDANRNIPDSTKEELKKIISQQFQVMGQFIGVTELLYLRAALPTDAEVEQWFIDSIGVENNCSASSAIFKFRQWLKDYNNQIINSNPQP